MKKFLLFSLSFFAVLSLSAEIHYTSYNGGWVIPMNANQAVDVDNDGEVDFYVNGYQDELGFVPVFVKGCFSSPGETAYVNFGARELKRHQEDDLIQLNNGNIYDYIDDDRGSAYSSTTGEMADGWVDLEDTYIGFVVLVNSGSEVKHGWLKAAIDITNQTLIIKEMAYTDEVGFGTGGILVGDKGESTNIQNVSIVEKISVTPNPATDFVQLQFEYSGSQDLTVVVQNNVGKEVYRSGSNIPTGNVSINLYTEKWSQGIYFIRFETEEGIRTERLSIFR